MNFCTKLKLTVNDMESIAKIITENSKFSIVIHTNPDGDCIGSALALARCLRKLGKSADIYCDGEVPSRLSFLLCDDVISTCPDKKYDVCIAVDVAELSMMGALCDTAFTMCKTTCCLDHHGTNNGYCNFNYVEPKASAAGEVIYKLINTLGVKITPDIALPLYVAIASDTGSFRYSNTTPATHAIVSALMETGIDASAVMRRLFEVKTIEQLRLNAEVVSNLKFYENGKICVCIVDEKMLSKYNMSFTEADDIASIPRSIAGVEVGIYIKVKGENDCKVSLRSNEYVDVSAIAKSLGGGGHIRAAGLTVKKGPLETEEIIVELVKKVI